MKNNLEKLKELIDEKISEDSGNKYRGLLQEELTILHQDIYKTDENNRRSHLGASAIGGSCITKIWNNFRWITAQKFDGRVLRLFNRGHLEEARASAALRVVGVTVTRFSEDGGQFSKKTASGHFGNSADGFLENVPFITKTGERILWEVKSANDSRFNEFVSKGLIVSNYQYYVQMIINMKSFGCDTGLIQFVNKNTEEFAFEIVKPSIMTINRISMVIKNVLEGNQIPTTPYPKNYWECKMCQYDKLCHDSDFSDVARTCRSCTFARISVKGDGAWVCLKFNKTIPNSFIENPKSCKSYSMVTKVNISEQLNS